MGRRVIYWGMPRTIILTTAFLALAISHSVAQLPPLDAIARRHEDAVVLVADARTGRLLGGLRMSDARTARFAPASLFKLAIAVTLLEGSARPDAEYRCTGADTLGNRPYRCWLPSGHGTLDLDGAIAVSCNIYFRNAARRLSRSTLGSRARSLGLLPPDYSARISDETLLGRTAPVSPAELMQTALVLASRGRLARPPLTLSAPRYRALYTGLRECVRSGTAHSAWSRRTTIGGKTGTAEIPGVPGGHAGWFVGFAPFERPQYAIVVLKRRGVGSDAAAIAREVLETLL